MKFNKLLFVFGLLAVPVFAAEGVPGGAVVNDGAISPYGRHGVSRDACKANPEKCRAEAQARREACKSDPEKCRKARVARREKWCAQNPGKCKVLRARMEQHRAQCQADPEKCRQERRARAAARFMNADVDGNGLLSRAEAEQDMPWMARHFDTIDTNKDGQLSRDELMAAREARHRARHQHKA